MNKELQKKNKDLLDRLLDHSNRGGKISEAELAKLSIGERLWLIQRIPLRRKADFIISSPDPIMLLKRLSPHEIYLIVKESWGDDAAIVLEMTAPEKIVQLMDIDIWEKDRVNYRRFMEWLELIAEGGERALVKSLFSLDPPLLVLFFKGIVEVVSRNLDQDPLEMMDGGFHSLDYIYYFRPKNYDLNFEMVISLLSSFLEIEPEYYKVIMEGIMGELPSPMEEEAYQLRSSRMATSGFPEFYEAREIFLYKDSDAIINEMKSEAGKVIFQEDRQQEELPPNYWLIPKEVGGFLEELLAEIGNSNDEGNILWELSYLVHKLVAAEGSDPADTGQIVSSVDMAKDYLNLGLEILTNGNREEGRKVLKEVYLQTIFRLGYSRVLEVKKRAELVFKRLEDVIDHQLWGNEANDLMRSLSGKRPFFYGGVTDRVDEYRNFRSVEDVDFVEVLISKLEWKIKMISNLVTIPVEIKSYLVKNAPVNNWGIETILMTAFAFRCLLGMWEALPLSREDLEDFRGVLKVNGEKIEEAKGEIKAVINRLSEEDGGEAHTKYLEKFFEEAYQKTEDELLAISDKKNIDPRFIGSLITVGR